MAIEKIYLSEGVSLAVFNVHTHNYRKITWIGVDDDDKYASPDKTEIVDDAETVASSSVNAEAVGITVSTQATEVPN